MAKLTIPTPLRKYTQNKPSFQTDSPTVKGTLEALAKKYPEFKQHVFDNDGNIRTFIKVYVGDQDIEELDGVHTQLDEDATLSLVPAIAGGTPDEPRANGSNGASAAFSKEELERYSRHLTIPDFNIAGQRKLKVAKVLVVGTGGLGAPMLIPGGGRGRHHRHCRF